MKFLLITLGFGLALVLGFFPGGISRPRPAWWRWTVIISMVALFVLALGVPTAGTFTAAKMISMSKGDESIVPIMGTVTNVESGADAALMMTEGDHTERISLGGVSAGDIKAGDKVIIAANFSRIDRTFHAHRIVSVNPVLALPLIPDLEERARNLYLHVPMAWISQIAWFVAFGFAIAYLRNRRLENDVIASSAAALGAIFCILATVTGAVWARFNWGVFWNWDPRQTSIAIVLIIYGAYFALRSALDNDEQRGKISAIYLILLLLPVLFFMFVFPRLEVSLHPGSKGDVNAGPVLSPKEDSLDPIKQAIYALSLFSFISLYFWMLNVSVRSRLLDLRRRRRAIASQEVELPAPTVQAMES